jgi:hypothetical protein
MGGPKEKGRKERPAPAPQWRRALRDVLRDSPVSIRELARASGLSHVALINARDGKIGLTTDSLKAIERAFRGYSVTCSRLAERLAAAVPSTEEGGDRAGQRRKKRRG